MEVSGQPHATILRGAKFVFLPGIERGVLDFPANHYAHTDCACVCEQKLWKMSGSNSERGSDMKIEKITH
jgi:hypothetical protein